MEMAHFAFSDYILTNKVEDKDLFKIKEEDFFAFMSE